MFKLTKTIVRFTDTELQQLIDALRLKAALYSTSKNANAWANDLVDYLAKWDEEKAV